MSVTVLVMPLLMLFFLTDQSTKLNKAWKTNSVFTIHADKVMKVTLKEVNLNVQRMQNHCIQNDVPPHNCTNIPNILFPANSLVYLSPLAMTDAAPSFCSPKWAYTYLSFLPLHLSSSSHFGLQMNQREFERCARHRCQEIGSKLCRRG